MEETSDKEKALSGAIVQTREWALELARALEDAKGNDIIVLDISEMSSFADFFVIATAASSVHMGGLYRAALDGAAAKNMRPIPVRQRTPASDEWQVLDFNAVVVHLMTAPARAFYDLENLWFGAGKVYP